MLPLKYSFYSSVKKRLSTLSHCQRLVFKLSEVIHSDTFGVSRHTTSMSNIKIEVQQDLQKMSAQLAKLSESGIRSAVVEAANETGFYIQNKLKKEMPRYLDKPVPFTINSLFVFKAKATNVEASVEWREFAGKGTPAGRYLIPQVEGGTRKQKRFEKGLQAAGLMPTGYFVVPTKDAPIDGYGNVKGSFYARVLSFLRADQSGTQNRTTNAKARNRRKSKSEYFSVIQGVGNNPLPSGVYERVRFAFGQGFRRIFSFVKTVRYDKRFPFYEIANTAARDKFPAKLKDAIDKRLNSSSK